MKATRFDVLAIGDALIDVIAHKEEDFVAAHGLAFGQMQPVDPARAVILHEAMGGCEEICGGSAANTIAALARFGLSLAFIGQTGRDRAGAIIAADMAANAVHFPVPPIDVPTGRCLIVVSSGGHRTMSTTAGASAWLPPGSHDPAIAAEAGLLLVEGYMWRAEQTREAARALLKTARAAGRRSAFTLSSEYYVRAYRDELVALLDAGLIDILLANEGEIAALTGLDTLDEQVAWGAARASLLVVTLGAKGAVAVADGHRRHVPAEPQGPVVDTTGAGDMFAAGLLAGLVQGRDLATAMRMGSIAAGRIVALIGPRLPAGEDLQALIERRLSSSPS